MAFSEGLRLVHLPEDEVPASVIAGVWLAEAQLPQPAAALRRVCPLEPSGSEFTARGPGREPLAAL